jgi:rhamnulokinase
VEGLPVIAIDFGATSIRVCRVDLEARPVSLRVVHRHPHGPIRHPDGSLRWDWARLVAEMHRGLEIALQQGPVASIGIDTWGVDYGLLDGRGRLVAPPFCYRDERTRDWLEIVARIGPRRLYQLAGLQLMPLNTIFQLAAHDPEERGRARSFLMLPELVVYELCGVALAEATSAGTTGLVDIRFGSWSEELLDAIGADPAWFHEIRPAGTLAGRWRGIPVHLVGGHDTASAVVAMAAHPSPDTAFVSAGTWFLVGRELGAPDTSERAQAANFSNEQGTFGSIRFLKNLNGMWLLEECRRGWGDPPVGDLLDAAAAVRTPVPVIEVNHPDLLAPEDMAATLRTMAGLPPDVEPAVIVKVIFESIADGVGRIVEDLDPVGDITIFGGASRSALLRETLAGRSGRTVRVGPAEATALGNALTQGVALGAFADQEEARASLAPRGGQVDLPAAEE